MSNNAIESRSEGTASQPAQAEQIRSQAFDGAGATVSPTVRPSWFARLQDGLAAVLLVVMVVAATVQVVMRYGFGQPLPWPEELARWGFLWMVMVGIAVATRTGAHIRVDVLPMLVGDRWRAHVERLIVALSAVSLGLLALLGVGLMQATTVVSVNLFVSYRYLYLAVPVGAVLALVNLARSRVPGASRWTVVASVVAGVVAAFPTEAALEGLLGGVDATTVAVAALVLLILTGLPIAHALLLASYVAFQAGGLPDNIVANHFASTMATNFVLLAIPFFVLMGALMNAGGITKALVDSANALVGHWRGGLGQVNILTSALMGGLSGSSSADTATITKTLVPEMERSGYRRDFACAITASSSILANLLPPSITLLIYASLAGASVGALFMAGIVPGVLLATALMVAVLLLARTRGYRVETAERMPWRPRLSVLGKAIPALMLPLVILMALRAGVMTATEAGAVACLYALLLGMVVYRQLALASTWAALRESARDTAVILFLVAASAPLAWLFVAEGVPQRLAGALADGVVSPSILMLGVLGILILSGLFLEPPPAMVILVPVIMPVATAVGIDPVHLGVVVVVTVMVGQLTPPVGGLVFITSALADVPVLRVFWALRWLYLALAAVVLLVALLPQITLALPRLMGF